MAKYSRFLRDKYSNQSAHIRSNDYFTFNRKIESQLERWERAADKRAAANEKQRIKDEKAAKKIEADERTEEAEEALQAYRSILSATLTKNDRIDWESLKQTQAFRGYVEAKRPEEISYFAHVPRKSWVEVLLPFLRARRERLAGEARFKYESATKSYEADEEKRRAAYEVERGEFTANQTRHNQSVDDMRRGFETGEPNIVVQYLQMVLDRSMYPDTICLEHDLSYDPKKRQLAINTLLPTQAELEMVAEIKYVASKDEFQKKYLTKSESKSLYADVIHQLAIRTIHEMFEAEYFGHVQKISFTGCISGLDTATGNDIRVEVLQLTAERDRFSQINLARVNPEECVKSLGGELSKIAFKVAARSDEAA